MLYIFFMYLKVSLKTMSKTQERLWLVRKSTHVWRLFHISAKCHLSFSHSCRCKTQGINLNQSGGETEFDTEAC
jgi:hypothetical protein